MERKEEGETAKMDRNPGAPPLYAQLEQILKQQNNDQKIFVFYTFSFRNMKMICMFS